jgi:enoyl-CoA hydratase/carnithine racemase
MLATLARDLELDTLTVEQDDRVLLVRFCDPPHNFMTARMQKDLDILTAAVDADISVGAVVLTGGAPKRYITHFDIAAIGGPCGGGGLEMSVCFDVRLAADDDAVGFILPELLIGLTTTVGGAAEMAWHAAKWRICVPDRSAAMDPGPTSPAQHRGGPPVKSEFAGLEVGSLDVQPVVRAG